MKTWIYCGMEWERCPDVGSTPYVVLPYCSISSWQMANGEWWMVNGEWWMVNGEWWMVNGEWWMVNGEWWMVNNGELQIANYKLQIANCKLQFANCELRIANCELQIANCELQIANCKLRIANCKLQIANRESRIANCAWGMSTMVNREWEPGCCIVVLQYSTMATDSGDWWLVTGERGTENGKKTRMFSNVVLSYLVTGEWGTGNGMKSRMFSNVVLSCFFLDPRIYRKILCVHFGSPLQEWRCSVMRGF
jgi:hypothetical protein